MSCGSEYWIWLQSALGAGANILGILSYYKNPEKIYNALCMKELDSLAAPYIRRKLASADFSQAYRIQKICNENGWHIVTPDSKYYPKGFLTLDTLPAVLYVNGDPSLLAMQPAIGFVGTRHASLYGKKAAESLSFSVASAGAAVVSGCALGIDSYSHLGALEANGKTIAYLGAGLDADYPKDNRSLRAAIARNGALVTEYYPGSEIRRANFPVRNRLIAASSLGTVVVEASAKSGALITANFAMEFGKDVFAVPGEITDSAFNGGNNLIHDGAKPVFKALDILEEYGYDYDSLNLKNADIPLNTSLRSQILSYDGINKISKPVAKKTLNTQKEENIITEETDKRERDIPAFVSDKGKTVYSFILSKKCVSADEIAEELLLSMSEILPELTTLEIAGLIAKKEGNKYFSL